jgi:cyanophycin synthetase
MLPAHKVDPTVVKFEADTCKRLWRDVAADLGITVTEHRGILVMQANHRTLRVQDHLFSCESAFAACVSNDKPFTNSLLRDAGVKVPDGKAFSWKQRSDAVRFGLSIAPCVTKPCNGAFGVGVSVNLSSPRQIRRGFAMAELFGDVLVEQFAAGDNYRALVLRGRCISIVRRQLAAVIGDGRSTIAELISQENSRRQGSLLRPLRADRATARFLHCRGLSLESIPTERKSVSLASVCNYQHGTSYAECLTDAHPEIISAAERAALAVEAVVSGVDVISADIRKPDYIVNEVNTMPLLLIHYAAPNHRDPIRAILLEHFDLMPSARVAAH